MGWQCESGEHEGYVVGLEQSPNGYRWHELNSADDAKRVDGDPVRHHAGLPVTHIQVACDCGWRSPRLVAPLRACWFPSFVDGLNESQDERARQIWKLHVEQSETAILLKGKYL